MELLPTARDAYIPITPIIWKQATPTTVSTVAQRPTEWDVHTPWRMIVSISMVMAIRNASGAGLLFPMQDLDVRYLLMVDMNCNLKKITLGLLPRDFLFSMLHVWNEGVTGL